MVIASRPSKITLPQENKGWRTVLEFLAHHFPLIKEDVWLERIDKGKVHWLSGEAISIETPFKASQIICYYREVQDEPEIPFLHKIIYQDEHILVADKPHFLPVTPGGKYVNECLLERLRKQNKLPNIVPMHRLDRETAGLVIFSINQQSRGTYCQLFAEQQISKIYRAIAELPDAILQQQLPQHWKIENRLEKSKPAFTMHEVKGEINAQSKISLIETKEQLGLFELKPITGKTHQLRLHMMKIGTPILNDKFYPKLLPEQPDNFDKPLQLLAKKLSFKDPLTGKLHIFKSKYQLEMFNQE